MKIARQFTGGNGREKEPRPGGTPEPSASLRHFNRAYGTTHRCACRPGVETPGYFQSPLRGGILFAMRINRSISMIPSPDDSIAKSLNHPIAQ